MILWWALVSLAGAAMSVNDLYGDELRDVGALSRAEGVKVRDSKITNKTGDVQVNRRVIVQVPCKFQTETVTRSVTRTSTIWDLEEPIMTSTEYLRCTQTCIVRHTEQPRATRSLYCTTWKVRSFSTTITTGPTVAVNIIHTKTPECPSKNVTVCVETVTQAICTTEQLHT